VREEFDSIIIGSVSASSVVAARIDEANGGSVCVFGFRNFENYRLRVLAHCGWDGIINRVKWMPFPR